MLYLCSLTGNGTKLSPFRPLGIDGITEWAMLDLRDDCTKRDGWCFVWTPYALTLSDKIQRFACDPLESAYKSMKLLVNSKLGVDVAAVRTISKIFGSLLFTQHKKWLGKVNRWNAVLPENHTGIRDVWINGKLWARRVVKAKCLNGIDPSDTFVRANETPLASPWTRQTGGTGNINLVSNSIQSSVAGDKFYYYSGGTSQADQTSSIRQNAAVTEDDWGPAVRIGVSAFSGYWYSKFSNDLPTPKPSQFNKFVSGSFTFINKTNTGGFIVNGDISRCWISGSSIHGSLNGIEPSNSPQTDTSLTTTGNGAGIMIYQTGGGLNNWQGGDLSPVAVSSLYPALAIPTAIMCM